MPDWPTLSLFIAAAAVLVVLPGPNTLYIVARSLEQGTLAGLVSCVGVLVATLVHVSGAALGLSALVLAARLQPASLRRRGLPGGARPACPAPSRRRGDRAGAGSG